MEVEKIKTKSNREVIAGNIQIKLTDNSIIRGKINLCNCERISEFINSNPSPYLIMFNSTVQGMEDKTIFINKNYIVWIAPDDSTN